MRQQESVNNKRAAWPKIPLPPLADTIRANERRGIMRRGPKDLYYDLMTMPLWLLLAVLVGYFLFLNLVFACLYQLVGGLGGAYNGHFSSAFFFSVQTLSTTGYGSAYPKSLGANIVSTAEIMLGQLNTAVSTGVVFARLARPHPRVLFSKVAVVRESGGVPVLMFRVGSGQRNEIAQARLSVVVTSYEDDDGEGGIMRRQRPLKLECDETPVFALSWMAIYRITPDSPLYGKTSETLAKDGDVLVCSLTGTDEALNATVTARHVYGAGDIRFGYRFVNILTRSQSGDIKVDYSQFHRIEHLEKDEKSEASSEIFGNND